MSIQLACGAECGIGATGLGTANTRHWSAITGTGAAIDTSIFRSGAKSYRFAAAATQPRLDHNSVTASPTIYYFRGYFLTTDATPSSNSTILYGNAAAGTDLTLKILPTGVMEMSFNSTNPVAGPTLSDNTWYGVECEMDVSANPNLIRWRSWTPTAGWVNQTNVSLAQAATTMSSCFVGHTAGPTSGLSIYWDDILIGEGTVAGADYSTTLPRPGHVIRLRPNADGVHSAFTTGDFKYNDTTNIVNTATDVYTYLDEDDGTSLADFISQNVAGAGKYVRIAFADTDETNIRCVGVTSTHHSAGTGANEMHLRVSDDGATWTNIWGDWVAAGNDTSDTTAHYRHKVISTKPSGGAWTTAAVNSTEMEWGNSDDVIAIPYIDSVCLEVECEEIVVPHITPYPQLLPQ